MNETDYALFVISMKEKLVKYNLKELILLGEALKEVIDYKVRDINNKVDGNDDI